VPDDDPGVSTLTSTEQDARARAEQLLERTHYDTDDTPERVRDARAVARALLEALDALQAERACSRALKQRCEMQQAILGKAVYQACET
jgi:hypothetical protein